MQFHGPQLELPWDARLGGECLLVLVGADGHVSRVGQPWRGVRLVNGPSGEVQEITWLKEEK